MTYAVPTEQIGKIAETRRTLRNVSRAEIRQIVASIGLTEVDAGKKQGDLVQTTIDTLERYFNGSLWRQVELTCSVCGEKIELTDYIIEVTPDINIPALHIEHRLGHCCDKCKTSANFTTEYDVQAN